jgi:hypothetical protein
VVLVSLANQVRLVLSVFGVSREALETLAQLDQLGSLDHLVSKDLKEQQDLLEVLDQPE